MADFESLSGKIDNILKKDLSFENLKKTSSLSNLVGRDSNPDHSNLIWKDKESDYGDYEELGAQTADVCLNEPQEGVEQDGSFRPTTDAYQGDQNEKNVLFAIDIEDNTGDVFTLAFHEGQKIEDVVTGFFELHELDSTLKEQVMQLIASHLKEHLFQGDMTPPRDRPIYLSEESGLPETQSDNIFPESPYPAEYSGNISGEVHTTNDLGQDRYLPEVPADVSLLSLSKSGNPEYPDPPVAYNGNGTPPPVPVSTVTNNRSRDGKMRRNSSTSQRSASFNSLQNKQKTLNDHHGEQPDNEDATNPQIPSDRESASDNESDDEDEQAKMYAALRKGWMSRGGAANQKEAVKNLASSVNYAQQVGGNNKKKKKKKKTGTTQKKGKGRRSNSRPRAKSASKTHERLYAYHAIQLQRREQKLQETIENRQKAIEASMVKPLKKKVSGRILAVRTNRAQNHVPAYERMYKEGVEQLQRMKEEKKEQKEDIEDWICPRCSFVNESGDRTCQKITGVQEGQEFSKLLPTVWVKADLEKWVESNGYAGILRRCRQPKPDQLFKPTMLKKQSANANVRYRAGKDVFTDLYKSGLENKEQKDKRMQKLRENEFNFQPVINENSEAIVEARRLKIKLEGQEARQSANETELQEFQNVESQVEKLWENTLKRINQKDQDTL